MGFLLILLRAVSTISAIHPAKGPGPLCASRSFSSLKFRLAQLSLDVKFFCFFYCKSYGSTHFDIFSNPLNIQHPINTCYVPSPQNTTYPGSPAPSRRPAQPFRSFSQKPDAGQSQSRARLSWRPGPAPAESPSQTFRHWK